MELSGPDLSGLRNEAGGHRVQRVPPSERKGRVHTSSVTVAILEPDRIEAKSHLDGSNSGEFRIDWFSGTGKGGQHRNRHKNCARVTHVGTGITRIGQSSRSRSSNLEEAIGSIREELCHMEAKNERDHIDRIRRKQTGTGMRGDKIRTYRFQDDFVKDHKSGKTANIGKIMMGKFELLWD